MAKKILFETTLTDVSTTDTEGIGTERDDREGNKYRWVYNASLVSTRVGAPAVYDATNYSSVNFRRHVLCTGADEDVSFFAGVFLSIIPTLNYGWIKTFGLCNTCRIALASGGSAAISDLMIVSTLTTTTGTSAARPYSFINGAVATATSAIAVSVLTQPFASTPVAIATATGITGTIPQTLPLFIRGL